MDSLLSQARTMPALLATACLAALGIALAAQHWGGLQPCVLCIYQRYAYGAALAAAVVGVVIAGSLLGRRLALIASGLAFGAGSAIAMFHVGVEQKWWKGTDACHAPSFPEGATPQEQLAIMLNQPFVACDVIPWELFGISMAGFNVLASLVLAALSFWAAFKFGSPHKKGLR